MHVHQPGLPTWLPFLLGHVVFISFDEQVPNLPPDLLAAAFLRRRGYLPDGFHHRLPRYMPRLSLAPSASLRIRHVHSPFCQLCLQQRIYPLMGAESNYLIGQVPVNPALLVLEVRPPVMNHPKRRQELLVVIPACNHPTLAFLSLLAQPFVGSFDYALTDLTA